MPRGRAIRSATLPALLLLAAAAVGVLGFLDARDLVHRSWTEPSHTVEVTVTPLTPVIIFPGNEVGPVTGPTQPSQAAAKQRLDRLREALLLEQERQALALPEIRTQTERVRAQPHSGGVFSAGPPRGWWLVGTSLPGTLLALGVLALIGAMVGLALRRGGYARAVLRLLRAVGFAALVGGPVAALVEYLVGRHYRDLGWTPGVDRWVLALVWVLVGGAFLAVAELVGRAAALRAELDEVI